jgi:hypothetical protein
MSTEWQPITWIFFHSLSLEYDDSYKEYYLKFFETFKTIIPCKICRNHYNENIDKDEFNLANNINKDRIFNWTIDLHNNVNKMHKKKIWSYDEAKLYYTKNKLNNNMLKYLIYSYIKTNFRKNPNKTGELINMIKLIPYVYPEIEKKKKLIDFAEKFELKRENFKKWIFAFIIILKS